MKTNKLALKTLNALLCLFTATILYSFPVLGSDASSKTLKNPEFCRQFLAELNKASIGLDVDPVRDFSTEDRATIYNKNVEGGLYQFESDVLELFSLAPELRDLKTFRVKWNLTEQQAFDAVLYYGTKVFYGDMRVVADPTKALQRLRELSKEYYISLRPELARHREYYYKNLTKLGHAHSLVEI